jgi:hypothetical protein
VYLNTGFFDALGRRFGLESLSALTDVTAEQLTAAP